MPNDMTGIIKKIKKGAAILLAASVLLSLAVSCDTGSKTEVPDATKILSSQAEESLKAFLARFVKGYPVAADGKWEYDCTAPSENGINVLACIVTPASCVDWTLYSDISEEDCFIEKTDDPRGWANDTHAYYRYDAATVELIAREIFNLSKDDISKLTERGENEFVLYKDNGSYFTLCEDIYDSYYDVTLLSVGYDGERYYVEFDADKLQKTDNDNEFIHITGKCRAELAPKTVDGREYWSLYRFKAL